MKNKMRVENWNGYDIRFVEVDGEWMAVLKDICDALGLRTDGVSNRLNPDMMERVRIDICNPSSNGVTSRNRARKTHDMIVINEYGIYEALFASRRLEARKFRLWSASVMKKLRQSVGLEGYEVLRMTDGDIQGEIDYFLDSIFYDPETDRIMQSVTVEGGDVEVVPFL